MGTLVVIFGPTGVGKTVAGIAVAKAFHCPILSCDSRQFYREMTIGTAPPSAEQLEEIEHFFVADRSIFDPYTAGKFEKDALNLLSELFQKHPVVLLVGGTGLYIDAVCQGIGETPAADMAIRNSLGRKLEEEGVGALYEQLSQLDAEYAQQIDRNNPMRVMRALEVCLVTGKPYSQLRKPQIKERSFNVLKVGIQMPREQLYERINQRVDQMIEQGLEQEAMDLYPHRQLNTLNTVGYREWFNYFEGKIEKDTAIDLIKRNSRRYAKRQMTWFSHYRDAVWFEPCQTKEIIRYIEAQLKESFHADENLDYNPML